MKTQLRKDVTLYRVAFLWWGLIVHPIIPTAVKFRPLWSYILTRFRRITFSLGKFTKSMAFLTARIKIFASCSSSKPLNFIVTQRPGRKKIELKTERYLRASLLYKNSQQLHNDIRKEIMAQVKREKWREMPLSAVTKTPCIRHTSIMVLTQ